jgi:hypothetical protein
VRGALVQAAPETDDLSRLIKAAAGSSVEVIGGEFKAY